MPRKERAQGPGTMQPNHLFLGTASIAHVNIDPPHNLEGRISNISEYLCDNIRLHLDFLFFFSVFSSVLFFGEDGSQSLEQSDVRAEGKSIFSTPIILLRVKALIQFKCNKSFFSTHLSAWNIPIVSF